MLPPAARPIAPFGPEVDAATGGVGAGAGGGGGGVGAGAGAGGGGGAGAGGGGGVGAGAGGGAGGAGLGDGGGAGLLLAATPFFISLAAAAVCAFAHDRYLSPRLLNHFSIASRV